MELTDLKNRIVSLYNGSPSELERLLELVEQDKAVYPFNEYEHLICSLLNAGGITYEQYVEIRTEYVNANPYLNLFELAPSRFGKWFAEKHVKEKCSKLKKPSSKLDSEYSNGQYDFWLDGIKVEVKASRAVDSDSKAPLYAKALSKDTNKNFHMNFQQLKPQYCDVFVWVIVFRDDIVLWVMGTDEVATHPLFSKGQHRGNAGNEGQLHIRKDNIGMFDEFELKDGDLEGAIRKAYSRCRQP